MQPYFFPYLGYFDLIRQTDLWIVFDTVQYIRHGWVNRNRVLHPKDGWQYIIVPLTKHSRDTPISEIRINQSEDWRERIIRQLAHYRGQAPHYDATIGLLRNCLSRDEQFLARTNVTALANVCAHLGIEFNYRVFSEMDLQLGTVEGPGDWALRISQALGAREYVNPPGGAHLFEPDKFAACGITLKIQTFTNMVYSCGRRQFVPGLSIVDVLMWNDVSKISAYLETKG